LKFGMSPEQVTAAWDSIGVPSEAYISDRPHLGLMKYSNVSVGTVKFNFCILKFVDERLFEMRYGLIPGFYGIKPQNVYNKLQKFLSSEYGKGESRNGQEIFSFWEFQNVCRIKLAIGTQSSVSMIDLTYLSIPLWDEVDIILKN
jgi:hypothetical protein